MPTGKPLDLDAVERLYVVEGLTAVQIAQSLQVSDRAVRRAIKKKNLQGQRGAAAESAREAGAVAAAAVTGESVEDALEATQGTVDALGAIAAQASVAAARASAQAREEARMDLLDQVGTVRKKAFERILARLEADPRFAPKLGEIVRLAELENLLRGGATERGEHTIEGGGLLALMRSAETYEPDPEDRAWRDRVRLSAGPSPN